MTNRDEARERLAQDLADDERAYPGRSFMLVPKDDLRALLSTEEVGGSDQPHPTVATGHPEQGALLLAELAKHPNLSLQAVESDFEGEPSEWAVFRESGGRSDREFNEIARADTPLAALTAALAAPDTPRFRCKRCGRDEIDCRANGCERGPCPMEFVG